jgi:hypothetical protein
MLLEKLKAQVFKLPSSDSEALRRNRLALVHCGVS